LIVFAFVAINGPAQASSGESGGGVTVVPDGSVIIQIANFLFLIFALNLLLYRPIRRILKERRQKIKGLESAIDQSAQSTREKETAFAKALKDARAKGLKEKESLVQVAEEEERSLVAAINAKAQSDLAAIREKIADEAERARQALQQEVDVFASEITKKILGRAV
jgi:F-type H+-transporting ATPase subunit b